MHQQCPSEQALFASSIPVSHTAFAMALILAAPSTVPAKGAMDIASVFEAAQAANSLRMGADGIELYDREIVEDDGPGADVWGKGGDVPKAIVRQNLQAKKILNVRRPQSRKVYLAMVVWPLDNETQPMEITINGDRAGRIVLDAEGNTRTWRPVELPTEAVRAGDNEILLSCDGSSGWGVGVAPREAILRNDPDRQSVPVRSFSSADGGASWAASISPGEIIEGEFMIRLTLDHFVREGVILGPITDLAGILEEATVISPHLNVKSVKIISCTDTPDRTGIRFSLRSGHGPVVDQQWGNWVECDGDGIVAAPEGRFVQWRAVLTTDDPCRSPVLKSVDIDADLHCDPEPWLDDVEIVDMHNEDIRYSSIPFEYERFDEPQLKRLRQKYKLDEVVASATSELDKMRKLQNWVSKQWKYEPPEHPYPAWDAHEILERKQGFCVQYAIVYMQCALSMGMQTRFVFGAFPNAWLKGRHVCGHEVNEYWSNEYGKWVMIDANRNELFLDAETGIPLGMLELRAELLSLYSPDAPLGFEPLEIDQLKESPSLRVWKGDQEAPSSEPPRMDVKWGCMHWMPRNNMYAHRYPEPIAQGRASWSWMGYWNWDDGLTPRHYQWSNYTGRGSDLEFTLNQVRWSAGAGNRPGEIKLRLGTVTPDFDTFLASIDGGDWEPVQGEFIWPLKQGRNRIEMRIRNRAGILGRKSYLELDYRQ